MWHTNLLNAENDTNIYFQYLKWELQNHFDKLIGLSMTQLGGDIFINFILAAVGEILGYFYNLIVADFWGRKPTLISG